MKRPSISPYDWIPPGGGVRWTRIGELGWHALTVPTHLGDRVLAALGDGSGAVIEEDVERRQTWLIEPNASAVQRFHNHPVVSVQGDDDSFLFVPGMTRDHTVWWRVVPTGDRLLTDAELLATAVTNARGRGRGRAS